MTAPHDEIQELLGAYALDALDDDERRAVEAHLPGCPRCRAETTELREVAAIIGNSAEAAPDGVWDKIVASLEEEPPPMRLSIMPRAGRTDSVDDVVPHEGDRRRRPIVLAAAAAAAVLLGIAGFGIGRATGGGDRPGLAAAAAAASRTPGARMVDLVTSDSEKEAVAVVTMSGEGYLLGSHLPSLEHRVYQLWGATSGGAFVSLGVLSEPGVMGFHVDGSIRALLVTKELRAVDQPTSVPILRGSIGS